MLKYYLFLSTTSLKDIFCVIHMSFSKAMFKWCQAQNTLKIPVWPNTLKILIFLQKCGEEAEGRYYNNFSSSHSEANTNMHNHPPGKKCLHGEKFYEEMWVNRLNNASNLYSIRWKSKCACSHSLWHSEAAPKIHPSLASWSSVDAYDP